MMRILACSPRRQMLQKEDVVALTKRGPESGPVHSIIFRGAQKSFWRPACPSALLPSEQELTSMRVTRKIQAW